MPLPALSLPIESTFSMSIRLQLPRPVAVSDVRFFETGWIMSVVAKKDEKSSPPWKNFVVSSGSAPPSGAWCGTRRTGPTRPRGSGRAARSPCRRRCRAAAGSCRVEVVRGRGHVERRAAARDLVVHARTVRRYATIAFASSAVMLWNT